VLIAVRRGRLEDNCLSAKLLQALPRMHSMLKMAWCRASRRLPIVVANQCDPQFISAVAH
jgi:hypothetical protein